MNILLTNDDGYNSKGIRLLKQKLEKYGNVYIVAPKEAMSAKSVSISINVPLTLKKEEENVYSFSGTPADCAAFGINGLGIDFDLVVSGCNNGVNISYDTVFSGTIGACIQALISNKKAIAFSTPVDNFIVVEKYFDQVFEKILNSKILSNKYILNVNFPYGEVVDDVRIAKEYYRKDKHFFKKEGKYYFAYRDIEQDFSKHKDSDCYMVYNKIVSISPISKTYFDNTLYKKIKNNYHF